MLYSFLESFCIQFTFQLFISESIFLIDIPRKKHFVPRLVGFLIAQIFLGKLWETTLTVILPDSMLQYVCLYIGYALLTIIPISGSFDLELRELIFILAGGYATEHMTFALSKIILYLFHRQYTLYGSLPHLLITRYIIYVMGAMAVYFLIIRTKKKSGELGDSDFRIVVLAFIIMVFAIGFSVYWSYPEEYQGTRVGNIICPAYSFLCCALVLLMEYYVLRENSMKREQEMMEQLLKMSGTQQKSSKEAIDIINMKCHDLKHQMKALEKIENDSSRKEYLQEIREAVSIYDATYHTGCSALDYVLREKTLIFNERNIEFSCMVEGKMISYMSSADVYALMGNALDNALEHVLKEKEGERVIGLQIRHHYDMALIHLENRCSCAPEFKDGIPVTRKKDKTQHGFGVKSMIYIVQKYGGEVLITAKNGKFNLDILLPLYQKKK
ncbi:ATP-binding protein [Lactonifactor longoviformis]|uniref:ATP-binding protein n=1 Tax=Lactonifactor longoviformis TaxID=341220 RepID=UPI0036F25583